MVQNEQVKRKKELKEEALEMDGTVEECLPGAFFRVRVAENHVVMASISGKMRQNKIRIMLADNVKVEVSPYDLTKGRITYRSK